MPHPIGSALALPIALGLCACATAGSGVERDGAAADLDSDRLGIDVWSYDLDAMVEGAMADCQGQASVRVWMAPPESGEGDGRECIAWDVLQQDCFGDGRVAAMHRDLTEGSLCRMPDDAWAMQLILPGPGDCSGDVGEKEGAVERITLHCTWRCMGAPCLGFTTYEIRRL